MLSNQLSYAGLDIDKLSNEEIVAELNVYDQQGHDADQLATEAVEQYGETFETGIPVTFNFQHNKESAAEQYGIPDKESDFGRGFEPSGRYVVSISGELDAPDFGDFDTGEITFNYPLVIENDSLQWKQKLSEVYGGATGSDLSQALIADGYDGVVTVDNGHTSEILDLTVFDKEIALYQGAKKEQETKLSALHNLTPENLAHADEMGGLAVPSIGIVKDSMGIEGYGSITMIGTKGLGDPEQVEVYDADAYTSTFPHPEYKKAKIKGVDALIDEVGKFTKKMEGEIAPYILSEIIDKLYNAKNPDPAGLISSMIRNNSVKAMFLQETTGKGSRPVIRDKRAAGHFAFSQPVRDYFASADMSIQNKGWENPERQQQYMDAADAVREAMREDLRKRYEKLPPAKEGELTVDELIEQDSLLQGPSHFFTEEGALTFSYFEQLRSDQQKYGQTEVDTYATEDRLNKKLKGKEAKFQAWVTDKVMSIMGDPLLTVGRKKVAYTLENIVDHMTAGRTQAAQDTLTFGAGNARAAASKQFTDLQWMRNEAEYSLKQTSELKEEREAAEKKLEKFRDAVIDFYKYDDTWTALDDSMKSLATWAKTRQKRGGEAALKNALRQNDFVNVPDSVIKLGIEAGEAMLYAPVPYFEAKPQRAVGLDEFAGAAVPNNVSDETLAILDKHGIEYTKYGKEFDEEARTKAVVRLRKKLAKQGVETLFQSAYHGTPHAVDKFTTDRIGTGEGNQVYGWGMYFAEQKEVAEWYRKNINDMDRVREINSQLTRLAKTMSQFEVQGAYRKYSDQKGYAAAEKYDALMDERESVIQDEGKLYEVDIPENDEYLFWDKPLSGQSEKVKNWFKEAAHADPSDILINEAYAGSSGIAPHLGDTTGSGIYQEISKKQGSDQAASEYLHSLGIRGIKYYDGASRRDESGSFNYVIFHDDDVEITKQYQKFNEQERGHIAFPESRAWFTITLTGNADLSTFLHESGHLFLELMQMTEAVEGVDPQAIVDMDIVREWLGAEKGVKLTTEQHEQFARGFEKYLMEGKAPSNQMREIFRAFKAWMIQVYKKLTSLGVDLNEDIRGVFDRLVATQDEIDSAAEDFELTPVFEAGDMMSPEAYTEYVRVYEKSMAAAREIVDNKIMEEIARQKTAEYKAQLKKVKAAVEQQWNARVDTNARSFLSRGKFINGQEVPEGIQGWKLNTGELKSIYPDGSVNKRLVGMHSKTGVSPDLLASVLGYKNGAELLQDLLSMPTKVEWIKYETDRIMREDYGDMMNDGSLEGEAAQAIHSSEVSQFLHAELKALNRGKPVTPLGIIRQAARDSVQQLRLIDLKPHIYRASEVKWAREAQRLVAEKDFDGAFQAKRKQLMNHYMFSEAVKAREGIDRIRNYLYGFSKKSTRERIGKASGGDYSYINAIDSLLSGVDLKKSVSFNALRKRGALESFIAEQEAAGNIVAIPEKLRIESQLKSYKLMTVEELNGLRDAVKNIAHLAKLKNKMQDAQDMRDFDEAIGIITSSFEENFDWVKHSDERNERRTGRFKKFGAAVNAMLTKMEFIARWADGNEQGPVHDILFEPMAQAQHLEYDMLEQIGEPIVKALKGMSHEQKARLGQKTKFLGVNYTGYEIVAIALNMGNDGNMDKMLRGEDWQKSDVLDLLNKTLKKEDWDFVQKVWDTLELLRKPLFDLEKRVTGLVPPAVKAVPIDTPYGTYRGGYYPVKYDRKRKSRTGKDNKRIFVNNRDADAYFEKDLLKKNVDGGMAETRTKYAGPILLDLKVIPMHIFETIHYVTHYEAVKNLNRILNDRRFIDSVNDNLGEAYLAQMNNWLANVANDRRQMDAAGPLNSILRHMRMGSTVLYLGFRAWTGIAQTLGLFTTADEIGGKWMVHGVKKMMKEPVKTWEFANKNSGEIRHAVKTFDREMRLAFDNTMRPGEFMYGPEVARASLLHIGYIQKSVNVAAWIGTYDKYIAEHPGMDPKKAHKEAVKDADAVVRTTQAGGAAKDLAAVQFSSEGSRLFTTFYTYFSVLYNRERMLARKAKSGDVAKAVASFMWLIAMPFLVEELIKGSDDDDEWLDYLSGAASFGLTGLPLGRDVGNIMMGESMGMLPATLQPLEQFGKAVHRGVGGQYDEIFWRQLVQGGGGLLRLPTKSAWNYIEGIDNVLSGRSEEPLRELLIKPER